MKSCNKLAKKMQDKWVVYFTYPDDPFSLDVKEEMSDSLSFWLLSPIFPPSHNFHWWDLIQSDRGDRWWWAKVMSDKIFWRRAFKWLPWVELSLNIYPPRQDKSLVSKSTNWMSLTLYMKVLLFVDIDFKLGTRNWNFIISPKFHFQTFLQMPIESFKWILHHMYIELSMYSWQAFWVRQFDKPRFKFQVPTRILGLQKLNWLRLSI